MALPAVAAIVAGVGAVLGAWVQYRGLKMGREESRRAERINLREDRRSERIRRGERAEEIGLQTRFRAQDVGFREAQFEEEKKGRAEDVAFREKEFETGETERLRRAGLEERAMSLRERGFENELELQKYQKKQSWISNMLTQLNNNPGLANNLIQISRGRR